MSTPALEVPALGAICDEGLWVVREHYEDFGILHRIPPTTVSRAFNLCVEREPGVTPRYNSDTKRYADFQPKVAFPTLEVCQRVDVGLPPYCRSHKRTKNQRNERLAQSAIRAGSLVDLDIGDSQPPRQYELFLARMIKQLSAQMLKGQ